MSSVSTKPCTFGLVIFASDIERMATFYRNTLQLDIIEKEKSHRVLASDELNIVIHGIHGVSPTVSNPPELRTNAAIKPAFRVSDLKATVKAARQAGGKLKPFSRAWKIRGDLVLDGNDPEGNVVQFKQTIIE